MAVISKLNKNGKDITKYNNATISNINLNGVDYHFAKPNQVTNGVCDNAVSEPLIDMQIYGNSTQHNRLPSEYHEVEYLQAKRGPYINTGFVPDSNTGIDLVFKSINYAQSQYILGVRDTAINYAMNGSSSRTDWDIRLDGSVIYSNIERADNKMQSKITMANGKGTWEIINLDTNTKNSFAITNKKSTATLPLGLFCYIATTQQQTITYTHYDLIVYSCKIYDGEVLARDFVPCYRKSDAVAGMYDLVNDVFYTNQGNGEFIIGNSMPSQEIPVEIESVGEYDEATNKYKIPIKISGKNLVNIPNITSETGNGTVIKCNLTKPFVVSSKELPTSIRNSNNEETSIWRLQFAYLDGTKVNVWDAHFKNVNQQHNLKINASEENPVTSITYRGTYIKEGQYSGIQIEYGEEATNYQPYIEPTITDIYLNEPLRKVGDYADYIDYKNKKVVRKVGVQTFDGSEQWTLHTTTKDGYGAFRNDGLLTPLIGAPISATFMTHFVLTYEGATANFGLGWYRFTYSSGNIAGSRLYVSAEQTTVEDFAEWLSNNKPSIVYPLATQTEETIELPTISTSKGTNIVDIETSFKPSNVEIEYWKQI